MKRKVIFTCTLCFLLCVCGCTPRTAGEIRRTDEESQADANAAGVVQGDSLKTPVENEATEWPTAEEIRTTIAAEQTEVYLGHPERKTAKWQRCDRERHIVDF